MLLNLKNKLKRTSLADRYWIIFGLVVFGFFVSFVPVLAQDTFIGGIVRGAIGGLVDTFVDIYLYFVGSLLTSILIPVLVGIAQYNNFIDNPIVATGWALVRDLANVFFIIVLLVIAFSTMLRLQTYHYKQALAKLILMIILINFSKVISGVLIDFFQVLMMTFVNGFKTALGGNFIAAFHIYDMLAFAQTSINAGESVNTAEWAVTGSLVLAAVGITVVTMTILIMIAVLLYRMVMLWILVVISPLAYFAYTIRPSYWSQWWSEFFKHLVSGPAIAFFLWLALLTAQSTSSGSLLGTSDGKAFDVAINPGEGFAAPFVSGFAVPTVILNFMAMTALMIGGLVVSQKMASQSGGAVGNFANKVRSVGTKAMMLGTGAAALGAIGRKPIDWGSRRVKAYQGMKENIRNKRAGNFAQGLINVEGKVKDNTIGLAGRGLKRGYNFATGKTSREKHEADYELKKREVEELTAKGADVSQIATAQTAADVAKSKADRARRYNKFANVAATVVGATVGGVATAGLGTVGTIAGIGLGALANKGAKVGLQKLAESGQAEQKAAKYMQLEKISEHRKGFADKGINDLRGVINNSASADSEKMASMIELVSRGFADDGDIPHFRKFIQDNGDKHVQGVFENEVDKNNQTMAIDRDGIPMADRIRLGIEKPEEWNTSGVATNMKDILDGHMDDMGIKNADGTTDTKKVFNGKKLLSSINKMTMAKQQSALDALAKIIADGSGSTDQVTQDRVSAAEEVLISRTRFDKIPPAHLASMSPKKIASHIDKNEKEFISNVIDNPEGLTPEVVVHLQDLPPGKFNKVWESIQGVERGDGQTIGQGVLQHLVTTATQKETDTGGSLNTSNADDNELLKNIANFAALTGKVENLNNSGLKEDTKFNLASYTASSDKLRVQELSKINFNNLGTGSFGKKFKNNILRTKKSYDIESAFNKQLFDRGNTNGIEPLIEYMKDITSRSLNNQQLEGETSGEITQAEAVDIKTHVLDAVRKFLNTPGSTVGKEFIDFKDQLSLIEQKRSDLNNSSTATS